MCYGNFPTRNGSKSTIATQKSEKGNKATVMSALWLKFKIFNFDHGRRNVHDNFLLLFCKSSIWFTEKHIFKIIIYFFNTSKFAANYVLSFEVYDGFIGQKILKIWRQESWPFRPVWLSCQYNKNTLVDLPSSVTLT